MYHKCVDTNIGTRKEEGYHKVDMESHTYMTSVRWDIYKT